MNNGTLISLHRNRQQRLRKKKKLLLDLPGSEMHRREIEAFYDRLIDFLDRIIGYIQGTYKPGDKRSGEILRK